MIKLYPAAERYSVDRGWLSSHLSFSFGEYYDPANTGFGVMRVCNEDTLEPGQGFGPHPHSDMEVVTIVLEGGIRHEDSLGHTVVTTANGIQRMTAGSGMIHAEYNASKQEPLHILQLWFMPRERGLQPSFETLQFDPEHTLDCLLPVVSSEKSEHTALINQDMTIYLSRTEQGNKYFFEQAEGRHVFLFVIEGNLSVHDVLMNKQDTARIENVNVLTIQASETTHFMLIDLP
ncbi:MAG: pirin family protein [Gorillibacterium sp.]|nr:pirin family protein [Gorillibacterium sp.]